MANSSIYNYRFYSKKKNSVDEKDYNHLYEKIFNRKDYVHGKLSSLSIPIIFDLDPNYEFVELLIEPYKNYIFHAHIDNIIESNKYDVWIRSNSDFDCIDHIGFNNDKFRVCKYSFDRIRIHTNDEVDSYPFSHLYKNYIFPNSAIDYLISGQYHSMIEIDNLDSNRPYFYDNRIRLKDKLDLTLTKDNKKTDCSGWYSEDSVYFFMRSLKYSKGIHKVEFFFKERLIRLYDSSEFEQCFMIDDWDNCADKEFLEYKKKHNYR